MFSQKLTTFVLLIFAGLLSFQTYTIASLQEKIGEAKIGISSGNAGAPAINITGSDNSVPDMVGGC